MLKVIQRKTYTLKDKAEKTMKTRRGGAAGGVTAWQPEPGWAREEEGGVLHAQSGKSSRSAREGVCGKNQQQIL